MFRQFVRVIGFCSQELPNIGIHLTERHFVMRYIGILLLVCLVCASLCACERTTWNVRAYDLSGKQVYKGELISEAGKVALETTAGKKVLFSNATVIMEEK
jgi:hypothetical protein